MGIAQHSSETAEHYTPPNIVEAARITMGGIDLDPASEAFVNLETVRATRILTKDDDGLSRSWHGRVFLNPPGGKLRLNDFGFYDPIPSDGGPGDSSAAVWWKRLAEEYANGNVTQAVFLAFTLEILRSVQDTPTIWPGDVPFCVPSSRIKFWRLVGDKLVVGKSPTHANLIAFLPPREGRDAAVQRFVDQFQTIGKVRT